MVPLHTILRPRYLRDRLERGGEGPLFAPLPTEAEEEQVVHVSLNELEGLPAELVTILEANGLVHTGTGNRTATNRIARTATIDGRAGCTRRPQ